MKLLFLLILFIPAVMVGQTPEINIIPRPQEIEPKQGEFKLTKKTLLVADADRDKDLIDLLNRYLKSKFGYSLKVSKGLPLKASTIAISNIFPKETVPKEGYLLFVSDKHISIDASDQSGKFYAIQSLIQLFEQAGPDGTLRAVSITDAPRFPYRGMHLDVGRHFMPVEFV
ncbi:MAG: beta-N-acetylhexosaminidase, partial [Acidobacteria bacterium]|nr:beta-N-acetylhexosaminidase [Acidobacteriota bacterium]